MRIAIVTDCGGQATGRMKLRTSALHPDANVFDDFESAALVEASGNIIDAIDAGAEAVLCNSAPRLKTRETNGGTIVFGKVADAIVVATVGTLGLVSAVFPDATFRSIKVDAFMRRHGHGGRSRFNFRGLEVFPLVLRAIRDNVNLDDVSEPHTNFPKAEPCVWLIDRIEGRPTNLKLSILRSSLEGFSPKAKAAVQIGEGGTRTLACYERLTDIPEGQLGLYEGSSGHGDDRFLEIAVMGGSAAERFGCKVGDPVHITLR